MDAYQSVLDTLRGIIESSVDDLSAAEITAESDLTGELGIDSLAMFEIADKAQEHWNIKISDEDISAFTTVDSMVAFVRGVAGRHALPVMSEA